MRKDPPYELRVPNLLNWSSKKIKTRLKAITIGRDEFSQCARVGLDPHSEEPDFESGASANSATRACTQRYA